MTSASEPGISRGALIGLLGMAAVVILAGITALVVQQHSSFPQARIGGPFVMEDTQGRRVTKADLAGRASALFFGYTSCPDVCPTTLSSLSSVMGRMGPAADRLNVVFVTVDPERDTAMQMRDYLSAFDPRIRGFTGTQAQSDAMARAYHVQHRRVPSPDGSYTVDHSATVYLMNPDGRLAGEINYGEDEPKIEAKLRALVQQADSPTKAGPRMDLWADAVRLARQICGF